ncbi:spermidine synthase [Shewanella sp. NFH-SH190041]|uniref:spermidine synthase n=1 Tax=Shewanella sp. NFH-SH190041 TaxID=2950245 RepID=UPI0021C35B9E|nr:fused MFS/spermidine synthase [Shewanella sp. NFH-SH190041]BDM63308.1 spermidine synthase [Shewanella sp. NFH-SH190041]
MSDYQMLWQGSDEWGEIRVLDDGQYRILSFGENDEQSKQLKSAPGVPQHSYVQAMLLSLMFCQPKSAIVLGLGGGALLHSLKQYDAAIKLTAVELRPMVIEAAKRYFQLQPGKKLQLIEADAVDFLASAEHKRTDLIFADIYTNDGVDARQLAEVFFAGAQRLLKANGILVLNCWKEHSVNRELLSRLQSRFADVYACLTAGGNWVVFAANTPGTLSDVGLKARAEALSDKLDYAASRSLSRFGVWQ